MAPHSSTLAWKMPWMEEPGRLQSMGLLESDMTEQLHFHFSLSCTGEGNGNPLQCSYLENPRDVGAWWAAILGSHRVGHDWSDLAAAAAAGPARPIQAAKSSLLSDPNQCHLSQKGHLPETPDPCNPEQTRRWQHEATNLRLIFFFFNAGVDKSSFAE